MCKPTYFDVIHYKLNAHMLMQKQVNKNTAMMQWSLLKNTLQSCNVNVNFIEPKEGLVDMVFAANGGLIHDNKALVSNFTAEPRKGESSEYFNYFKQYGFDTYQMQTPFEGAGDGLFSHNNKHLWLGYGFRSYKDSKNEITDIISDNSVEIHSLELVNENYYHLDTCFCPIGHKDLLLYPKAFTKESLKKIYDVFGETNCIEVSDEDAQNFACNSICIESIINNYSYITVLGNKFSQDLKQILHKKNYYIIENRMSQFLLSGGSTKCCVLNINKKLSGFTIDDFNNVNTKYYVEGDSNNNYKVEVYN